MTINTFQLSAQSVRQHMFPQWGDFSEASSPSAAIVDEMIEEEAGELAGKLYAEGIDAGGAITPVLDANGKHTAAWLWSLKTLRLMVAMRVLRASTMQDPELAKTYAAQLAARLGSLSSGGATALGDDGLSPGAPADGPTTHINVFGLKTDEARFMSSTVPLLRKDDVL